MIKLIGAFRDSGKAPLKMLRYYFWSLICVGVCVSVRVMTYVGRFGERYCLCRQGLHKNN